MSKSGIYKITNIVNDKVYIGQSIDIERRMKSHFNSLRKNKHYNSYLQNSFNIHSEENFIFEIIELDIPKEELTMRENYWINHYKSNDSKFGYNSLAPSETDRQLPSKETKQKISQSMVGNYDYSTDYLIECLIDYYNKYGEVPKVKDIDENSDYPSVGCYKNRFGKFSNALFKAGLIDNIEECKKKKIIANVKLFISIHNRRPKIKEFCSDNNLPTYRTVIKVFKKVSCLWEECETNKI